MYRLANIPHNADKSELDVRVMGETIKIVVVDPKTVERDQWYEVCSFYVGDHMLPQPKDLRQMIGRALITAINQARDAGYRQAQRDIRTALGV